MSKAGHRVLCMLLWTWGGAVYFLLEVAWKTATGEPERISWAMLIVAMLLTVAVERCGYQLPWEVPLFLQALACSVLVTAVEFVSGLIINVWLGLGVWDYSHLPGNIMGQMSLPFLSRKMYFLSSRKRTNFRGGTPSSFAVSRKLVRVLRSTSSSK